MNLHDQGDLEQSLTNLTQWRGGDRQPAAWEQALANHEQSPRNSGLLGRAVFWRMPTAVAASVAILLVTALMIAILPEFGKARSVATMRSSEPSRKQLGTAGVSNGAEFNDRSMSYTNDNFPPSSAQTAPLPARDVGGGTSNDGALRQNAADTMLLSAGIGGAGSNNAFPQDVGATGGDRQVVRKATIELEASDVRGVFLKAGMVISEAGGEFIEQSSLTGEGDTAQASLTLRIAANRVHAVLTALHDLAKVRSETQGGDDVTAAIVDLEARLRNEQRVEKELLELLDKRADAPLEDILRLRDQIARVRQGIEQIDGQQQRLSRLVSLATILVIIRPPIEKGEPTTQSEQSGLGKYFGEAIKDSWSSGMRFLADTLGGLLSVLVGGAIWWIALIVGLLALRQYLRRRAGLA